MSEDKVESLILHQFRRVHERLDSIEYRMGEQNARLHALEDHVSGLVVSVNSLTSRMDRVENRLDRIERRLDLVDAR